MKKLLEMHDLMTKVAWKYYKEELTQKEIAEKMDISRFKVMDLLTEAKNQGIVEIRINSPFYNCLSIEKELVDKFNLNDAIVVPSTNKYEDIKEMIAYGGAIFLEEFISSGDKIGVGWGQTLYAMIESFNSISDKFEDISIVHMWGGLTFEALSLNPYDCARNLADKLGGKCFYIFAPAIIESQKLRDAMLYNKKIKSALEKAKKVDKALVGIGQVDDDASLIQTGYISKEEMNKLKKKGAVGEILGRYYDINGIPVKSKFDDLIIGVDLDELSKVDKVMVFAGGSHKTEAIYGALQGEYLDLLVTDEETAKMLLEFQIN